MLSHLIYVSLRKESCTDEEITSILESCQKNNKKAGITGVLLYSDKKFIQYLEGDYNKILALFDKIKEDSRHTHVIMLRSSPIKERSFPSWEMAGKFVDLEKVKFRTDVSPENKKEIEDILAGKTSNNAIPTIKRLFA